MNQLALLINRFVDFRNNITKINIGTISLYSILSIAIILIITKFILRKVSGI